MPVKRYNISFNPSHQKVLDRLCTKWGLDVTNTLRHMLMVVAAQEGIDAAEAGSSPRSASRTKKVNRRGGE